MDELTTPTTKLVSFLVVIGMHVLTALLDHSLGKMPLMIRRRNRMPRHNSSKPSTFTKMNERNMEKTTVMTIHTHIAMYQHNYSNECKERKLTHR